MPGIAAARLGRVHIPSPPTLEDVGKLAALVGLLLPVTGVAFRAISFLLSGGKIPVGLATGLPVYELAVVGVKVLGPGCIVIGVVVLAWLFVRLITRRPDAGAAAAVLAGGLVLIPLTSTVRFVPAIGGAVAWLLVFLYWMDHLEEHPTLSVWRLVLPALTLVACTAVPAALAPRATVDTYVVSFEDGVGVEDGYFGYVAANGTFTYLLACDSQDAGVLAMKTDRIRLMRHEPIKQGGLITADLIGFAMRCPGDGAEP